MSGYFKVLLDDDVYYDEANPKYRCFFNKFHAVKLSKIIAILQIFVVLTLFVYYFPESAISLPVIGLIIASTIYAYYKENALTLLPLYAYFIVATFMLTVIAFTFMGLSLYNYAKVLLDFEEDTVSRLPQKISHIMISEFVLIFIVLAYYWQMTVVFKCRLYYTDKREQSNYMQLAIPESFVDTKITEKLPIQPKKSKAPLPDNVVYSLEEVSLGPPAEKSPEKIA
uniref:Uncharacterized protein n=1 Tax=Acrobeloides nanus TaxID=290746 RepID=A0A914E130_9BILA